MCNDHAPAGPVGPAAAAAAARLSRRGLLVAAGMGAATAALGGGWESRAGAVVPGAARESATTFDGTTARSMAMHIHSSFSEGVGSMEAHLQQAQQNAVDVLWWTDHDHRMQAAGYRNVVHFTSLTAEKGDGPAWSWQRRTTGSLASSSGGIAGAGSPNDPIKNGSLTLAAKSKSSAPASLGYLANTDSANNNERANLYGQVLTIEVLPTAVGSDRLPGARAHELVPPGQQWPTRRAVLALLPVRWGRCSLHSHGAGQRGGGVRRCHARAPGTR